MVRVAESDLLDRTLRLYRQGTTPTRFLIEID
jgi:hypothetical protein